MEKLLEKQNQKTVQRNKQTSEGKCSDENERILLERVVNIRKDLKITQRELATMSGNTQQEISRLEKQRHSPSIRTLCRILNSIGYELTLAKRAEHS